MQHPTIYVHVLLLYPSDVVVKNHLLNITKSTGPVSPILIAALHHWFRMSYREDEDLRNFQETLVDVTRLIGFLSNDEVFKKEHGFSMNT